MGIQMLQERGNFKKKGGGGCLLFYLIEEKNYSCKEDFNLDTF